MSTNTEHDAWKLSGLTNESKQTGEHQHPEAPALPGRICPYSGGLSHVADPEPQRFF